MTRHRLPALALVVAALVAVVAVVAHGRPLAASAGQGGLPSSFWDYLVTSAIIILVLGWLAVLATALSLRPDLARKPRSSAARLLRTLLNILVLGLLLVYLERHVGPLHFGLHQAQAPPVGGHLKVPPGGNQPTATSGPHFLWEEAAIVFGLLVVAGVILAARRKKAATWRGLRIGPEAVAAALDESLDDLRTDPDLRRAIVAAYARMEKALGVAGLPRRPAEAPLEYLERALLALDTSGPSVRRLTDLFEWARFSQHEPEPSMRDEAVDALESVRDELRAPVEAAT